MDLLSVLPDFPTKPYAHILPPLERSKITTVDLITLDTLEIAKRAHVPPTDVRRLSASIIKALHHDIGFEDIDESTSAEPSSSINYDLPTTLGPTTKLDLSQWSAISTLDTTLDELLGGGVPTRYVTEVTGERYVRAYTGAMVSGPALTGTAWLVGAVRRNFSSLCCSPSSFLRPGV
jgi:DNA repair protein RAD57